MLHKFQRVETGIPGGPGQQLDCDGNPADADLLPRLVQVAWSLVRGSFGFPSVKMLIKIVKAL